MKIRNLFLISMGCFSFVSNLNSEIRGRVYASPHSEFSEDSEGSDSDEDLPNGNIDNAENIQVVNVDIDNSQEVEEYQLFSEDGTMLLPTQFTENDGDVTLSNTQSGRYLTFAFLRKKYNQFVSENESEYADIILSVLNEMAENANHSGEITLYNRIASFMGNPS